MVENHVGHADKHVFLDVGIKLAVHLLQNVGGRWISGGLAPQDAAADGHDDGSRHAFARNVRNGDAELAAVHFDVIEVIATDVAGGNVQAADLQSWDDWRFAPHEDALDVPRDLPV